MKPLAPFSCMTSGPDLLPPQPMLAAAAPESSHRLLWTGFVLIGAVTQLDFVWLVADTLNAFMAFPNLVSLLLLSPVVVRVTNAYFDRRRSALA